MRRTKKDNYTLYFVGTIEIKPSRPIYAAIENKKYYAMKILVKKVKTKLKMKKAVTTCLKI